MSITWSKYFDRIYCIHFVPYVKRKQLMEFELNRVGILDSGIFEWFLNFDNNINIKFNTFLHNLKNRNNNWINESITLTHYKVIRDAYYRGYNRVLILEDDVRFLKNLNKIEQYLENRPEDANLIMYDKFIENYEDNKQFQPVNKYYFTFNSLSSAGCYQLDRKGMKKFLNLIESNLITIDGYFSNRHISDLKHYTSNINLAVQCIFNDSINLTKWHPFDVYEYQKKYKFLNIDFDDYKMREDGKPFYYGDYIDNSKKINIRLLQTTPTEMNICLIITMNHFDKLLPLIYSIQKFSKSKLNFYLVIDTNKFDQYNEQLNKLKDERTTFNFIDGSFINEKVNIKFNHFKTMMSYVKLFIPTLFPNLDRILYLDYDTIIAKQGIEQLYNTNFEDNYLVAVGDIETKEKNIYSALLTIYKESKIFEKITNNYFNSGVLLFNIPKILEDKKDVQISDFLKKDPPTSSNNQYLKNTWFQLEFGKWEAKIITFQFCDQSVFNYIFRNNVKIISSIFNNLLIGLNTIQFRKYLKKKQNFDNQQEFMANTIIFHFVQQKPWELYPENEHLFNKYKLQAIKLYNKIKKEMKEVLK